MHYMTEGRNDRQTEMGEWQVERKEGVACSCLHLSSDKHEVVYTVMLVLDYAYLNCLLSRQTTASSTFPTWNTGILLKTETSYTYTNTTCYYNILGSRLFIDPIKWTYDRLDPRLLTISHSATIPNYSEYCI